MGQSANWDRYLFLLGFYEDLKKELKAISLMTDAEKMARITEDARQKKEYEKAFVSDEELRDQIIQKALINPFFCAMFIQSIESGEVFQFIQPIDETELTK